MREDTRPIIVAIEGADGSGKTRHVRAAVEALWRAGHVRARAFHHPQPDNVDPSPTRTASWYATVRRRFLDGLSAGDIVIADRWFWSTLARREGIVRASSAYNYPGMRDLVADEADAMLWGRDEAWLSSFCPKVIANRSAPTVPVRMAAIFLDSPDWTLDARLAARGEALPETRHGERAFYRRAQCIDTSEDGAGEAVSRLVVWAVDGIRMGAL